MKPDEFDFQFFSFAALMGFLIGLGQILDTDEKLSWRIVVGRALVSAGIASAAPVLLIIFPNMPRMAEFALAAAFASLGTSGLQMVVRKYFGSNNQ